MVLAVRNRLHMTVFIDKTYMDGSIRLFAIKLLVYMVFFTACGYRREGRLQDETWKGPGGTWQLLVGFYWWAKRTYPNLSASGTIRKRSNDSNTI